MHETMTRLVSSQLILRGTSIERVRIGCGDVFHPDWINLDVAPVSPGVLRRKRGEVHRVMDDKYSLARPLIEAGFSAVRNVNADESWIAGFAGYGPDAAGGEVRKPDSLFMEAVKP